MCNVYVHTIYFAEKKWLFEKKGLSLQLRKMNQALPRCEVEVSNHLIIE